VGSCPPLRRAVPAPPSLLCCLGPIVVLESAVADLLDRSLGDHAALSARAGVRGHPAPLAVCGPCGAAGAGAKSGGRRGLGGGGTRPAALSGPRVPMAAAPAARPTAGSLPGPALSKVAPGKERKWRFALIFPSTSQQAGLASSMKGLGRDRQGRKAVGLPLFARASLKLLILLPPPPSFNSYCSCYHPPSVKCIPN
jgi:hypothetical protein